MTVKVRKPVGRPKQFDKLVAVRLPMTLLLKLDRAVAKCQSRRSTKEMTRADIIRFCIQDTLRTKRGNRG